MKAMKAPFLSKLVEGILLAISKMEALEKGFYMARNQQKQQDFPNLSHITHEFEDRRLLPRFFSHKESWEPQENSRRYADYEDGSMENQDVRYYDYESHFDDAYEENPFSEDLKSE